MYKRFMSNAADKLEEHIRIAFANKEKKEKMYQLGLIAAKGGYRKPTYETIGKWLEVLGWSFVDFYKIICGIDISWGDPRLDFICRYLDSISDESVSIIYDIALALLPDTTRQQFEISSHYSNNSHRIIDMIMVNGNEDNNAITTFREFGIERKWKGRKLYKAVPIEYYPVVASRFRLALHWMLGLDETATILAQNGTTEVVMDVITMLPDFVISSLYNAILMMR